MKYKFLKDGNIIEVDKEKWCWEAYYTDGSFLKQFDDGGWFHQFSEIDQSRLKVFKMVGDGCHTLLFSPKMKLVHYYKRYVLNFGTVNEKRFTAYVFGYEVKINNRTVKNLQVITPSGETVLTENPADINYQ